MKKTFLIITLITACAQPMLGQAVIDALPNISGQLKGTARQTAMGGAFGALGGELSSIAQNPAGIGVYRSSEISVTPSFNFFDNSVKSPTGSSRNNDFYFTADNMGVVGVINFNKGALRNLNFGFAYNNISNFNNKYRADWGNIGSSITQFIASQANSLGCYPHDLALASNYNPYDSNLPWLSVLGYNTNLIHPLNNNGVYNSIFSSSATSGNAALIGYTSGGIDEYDFNISGNIWDKFYWGVTVNVNNILYRVESYYSETLQNAQVANNHGENRKVYNTNGTFELQNLLRTTGYGAGAKLGIIYRPTNALRLGIAFHTPTFYEMTDTYSAAVDYRFDNVAGKPLMGSKDNIDNQTDLGSFSYNFSTPWHLIGSVAMVLGKSAIISVDYEYIDVPMMSFSSIYHDYTVSNNSIKEASQGTHNVRLGAEYRISPAFSVRAGYAYESSPIKAEYYSGNLTPMIVEGTLIHYQIPGDTHNITCGVGYSINNISIDAAYVFRMQPYSIYAYPTAHSGSYSPTIMDTHLNSLKITLAYRF